MEFNLEKYAMQIIKSRKRRIAGGRGLPNFQDSVDTSIRRFEDYIKNVEEDWLQRPESIYINTNSTSIKKTKITRKQKWEEKQLYGYFKRQTTEIFHEKTWTLLRNRNLKQETESLLKATQNNAIRTNFVKAKIDKTKQNSCCKLLRRNDQSHDKQIQ